jgi:polyisoprenoid-binding protein YceI
MASFVKTRLLEVAVYPEATFDGTVRRHGGDASTVEGTLRLHGVEREIRFEATLHEEAGEVRLLAVFDLARRPFQIGLQGVLDGLVPDDIRVTLDVRARAQNLPTAPIP